MSFIIVAAAMFLAAVGFIVIPLLKRRDSKPVETAAANRAVHDARLAELQSDVAAGALAEEDYGAAERDLEGEFADPAPEPPARRSKGWIAAVAVAAVVPIVTAVLYLQLGSWQSALYGDQSPRAITANVVARLEKSPNDVSGWEFLGQTYSETRQYDKAVDAWRHAAKLSGGKNGRILSRLGASEMLANKMQAGAEQARLFDKALKLDPRDSGALLFGGIVAMQQGDKKTAIDRWQRLLRQDPPARLRKLLAGRIAAAGGTVPATGTASTNAATGTAAIDLQVKLASKLKANVPADATLFVFVRPADQASGPPLAVRRLSVDQFPVQVRLSDADAMIPGHQLENHKHLRVMARISKTGKPLEHPGDIFGSAKFSWNHPHAPLNIVLDQVASD
jgi:cytochrome c-type biogenesis protein CcmH